MKSNFKLAWQHLKLAIGFALVACGIAVLPKDSPEKRALITALVPFEWERTQ